MRTDYTVEELAHEIWKPIPGFEGRYEVSDLGRIKSLKRWHRRADKIIKPLPDRYGYFHVVLLRENEPHKLLIHRLAMLAFEGSSNLEVNHKHGIKSDNRLCHLEYTTGEENKAHAKSLGISLLMGARGEMHHKSKLTDVQVEKIKALAGTMFQREIAALFGITRTSVNLILSGKRRNATARILPASRSGNNFPRAIK